LLLVVKNLPKLLLHPLPLLLPPLLLLLHRLLLLLLLPLLPLLQSSKQVVTSEKPAQAGFFVCWWVPQVQAAISRQSRPVS
jgi:hypothetical protein